MNRRKSVRGVRLSYPEATPIFMGSGADKVGMMAGILISQKEPEENTPKASSTSETLPPPRLSAIRPEDFQDIGRALELFHQAVQCGLAPNDSEHTRLLWMAAIERARTVPARNPAGLFLFLVKNRKWDFLSNGHFDAAHARLKAHLYGADRRSEGPPLLASRPAPERLSLSKDALLVQVVRNELARRGIRCELFSVLRTQAGWDRARFEAALAELEAPRRESSAGREGLRLGCEASSLKLPAPFQLSGVASQPA